jgi:hypothetical protein
MKSPRIATPSLTACALLAACSGGDARVVLPGASGDAAGAAQPGEEGPAVLVAAFVRNPDGRNIYVGAEPDVPTGELDYSRYLEFGNVDVTTDAGYVFVWDRDPATMTRYTVGADLALVAGPTISFANYGVSGSLAHVFISETRAYTPSPQLDSVVVWNPQAMEITGTLPMDPPERPAGLETFFFDGRRVGDRVIWSLASTNFDGVSDHPAVAVAIASAFGDEPVQVVEDERCVGVDGTQVDAEGNYILRAGASWGTYAAYGERPEGVRTCLLRIRAGERQFDPDYLVDMRALTGSYVNFPWFHVQGSQYLAQPWDPGVPLPEVLDDYWNGAGLTPMLVDIGTGESQPYPDVAGTIMVSSMEFELDGVAYYQLSQTGTVVNGSAQISELRPTGLVPRFSLPELWALARIR